MIVRRNNKKTSIPNFLFQNYKDKDHKTIDKIDNDLSKISDTLLSQSKEEQEKIIDEKDINITSSTCTNVINEFLKIKECSIVKYGIKISTDKIYYGYCQTCDANLIHPICIECARMCHQLLGHKIREMKI